MEIVPRSFGDNLNDWFRTMGKHWQPLLFSSLALFVPFGVIVAVVVALTGVGGALTDLFTMDGESLESLSSEEAMALVWPFIWSTLIWAAVLVLASVALYVACGRIVAEDRAGLTPKWTSACRFALRKLIPTTLAAIIAMVASFAPLVLAGLLGWALITASGATFFTVFATTVAALTSFVFAYWIGMSLSLYPQVAAMENTGVFASLARSFRLVKTRWWTTLGFLLLASLIASVASQILSLPLIPLFIAAPFYPAAASVAYGLVIVLQAPVIAAVGVAYAIWYLDLRARQQPFMSVELVQEI